MFTVGKLENIDWNTGEKRRKWFPQSKDDYCLHLKSALPDFFLFWLINLETFSLFSLIGLYCPFKYYPNKSFLECKYFGVCFFVCDTGKKEGREGGRKYNLSICYVAIAFTLLFTSLHKDLVREVLHSHFIKEEIETQICWCFRTLSSKNFEFFWF